MVSAPRELCVLALMLTFLRILFGLALWAVAAVVKYLLIAPPGLLWVAVALWIDPKARGTGWPLLVYGDPDAKEPPGWWFNEQQWAPLWYWFALRNPAQGDEVPRMDGAHPLAQHARR
jgi:hypothetical protein